MLALRPSTMIPTTTLLLTSGEDDRIRRSLRRQSVREAARFLRRASTSSRRMIREPSILVRESVAKQLEERQSDWAYSKPVVILDFILNFVFVAVAVAVMILSADEATTMLLRLWIVGYRLQCLVHRVCVWSEYKKRRRRWREMNDGFGSGSGSGSMSGSASRGNVCYTGTIDRGKH